MIVSPFHLLDIQQELVKAHTMMLCRVLFCKTPESFYPINVHITFSKHLAVINGQMFVTVENQRVIASPLVRVHDASFLHFLDGACKSVFALRLFTISTCTFPFLSSIPKTIVLFLAPRPRFPFLLPPK